MATYTELVDKIISWSNRDVSVFGTDAEGNSPGYTQIRDFINYAADNAYRKLRVVPLEATRTFKVKAEQEGETSLNIPVDAIEFIQLSRIGDEGEHFPYSSKLDIISFRELIERLDGYVTRSPGSSNRREDPSLRFWTRHQGELVVNPPFIEGDEFELYYYRRLPAPDARFAINSQQYTNGVLEQINDTDLAAEEVRDPNIVSEPQSTNNVQNPLFLTIVEAVNGVTQRDEYSTEETYEENDAIKFNGLGYTANTTIAADAGDPDDNSQWTEDSAIFRNDAGLNIVGRLTQNWLRDENEKVLLFGALAEAFDFLEEPEQSQKYMAKFMREIEELNMEDTKRIPSGGTIYINYGSNLL